MCLIGRFPEWRLAKTAPTLSAGCGSWELMGTRNNSMVSKLVLTGFGGGQERNLVGKPVAMSFGNSALPVAPL